MKIEDLIKGALTTAIYLPADDAYKKPILADLNEMIDVCKVDDGYKVRINFLEVADNKAKLPAENIERIFGEFVLSSIMTFVAHGWGIGPFSGQTIKEHHADYIVDGSVSVKYHPFDEEILDDCNYVDMTFVLKIEEG